MRELFEGRLVDSRGFLAFVVDEFGMCTAILLCI